MLQDCSVIVGHKSTEFLIISINILSFNYIVLYTLVFYKVKTTLISPTFSVNIVILVIILFLFPSLVSAKLLAPNTDWCIYTQLLSFKLSFIHWIAYLLMVCAYQVVHMEIRGQFLEVVSSFLLSCEFWTLHSGHQVWWQAPGPIGSPPPPHIYFLSWT